MLILVTGHSGFLGSSISAVMKEKMDLYSLGRQNTDVICDLATQIPKLKPSELVIHAAGKAHSVPKTEAEKQAFFDVNVNGTLNLLKGLEQSAPLPKSFVFISSVAVYGAEKGRSISEGNSLSATDPYGRSKIEAEKLIQDWCAKHNVICGILRLPLLVGAHPPGNLGAMIKAIRKGYYFNIAGGHAKKSMVLAKDVAGIIPKVAEIGGVYNLTDGYHPSFSELSHTIAKQLNQQRIYNMPKFMASFLAIVGDMIPKFPINSSKLAKITSDLTFDDEKARKTLGWQPSKVLDNFSVS